MYIKNATTNWLYKLAADMSVPAIYVVRHGKTKLNSDGNDDRIRGWQNLPLDEEGIKQAEIIGKQLKDIDISKIYTSDLQRSIQTVDGIKEHIETVPIITTIALRPWHLGIFEGQESSKVQPELANYVTNFPDKAVPEGESFNTFKKRALDWLKNIIKEFEDINKNILAVTHYRNIRLFNSYFKAGAKEYDLNIDEFLKKGSSTGSIYRISNEDGKLDFKEI